MAVPARSLAQLAVDLQSFDDRAIEERFGRWYLIVSATHALAGAAIDRTISAVAMTQLPGAPSTASLQRTAFLLDKATGDVVIGRSPACTVELTAGSVSKRHALLARTADGYALEDLGSSNGTAVGGDVAAPGQRLAIPAGVTPIVFGGVAAHVADVAGIRRIVGESVGVAGA